MVSPRDIEAEKLIKKTSEKMKKLIDVPEWTNFVKTGVSRQRTPENKDWWFIRTASVLRKIYIRGPLGVSKLKSMYGGRKNRGHKPSHARKGSGKIIRNILQQLEKIELIQKIEKPVRGRKISSKGEKFLVSISKSLK